MSESEPKEVQAIVYGEGVDMIVAVRCPECGRAQGSRELKPFPCTCGTWLDPKASTKKQP